MAEEIEGLTLVEQLDTRGLRSEISELTRLSSGFGSTISRAFAGAVVGGRKLSDVLKSLMLSLSRQTLTAALRPFGDAIGGLLAGFSGSLTQSPRTMPFAKGGIIAGPSAFPLRGGVGLAGEAGAEAILPLRRGADGRLGVAAAASAPVQVTVNISTPDLGSFQRSQSQIAAMMVRAVERGRRNL